MKKTELPCGIVEDLLPSYVDGLTGEESSEAVREHLSGCETCRKKYEAMKKRESAEHEEAQREVNYLKTVHRSKRRGITVAIICTALVLLLGWAVKTYVIGERADLSNFSYDVSTTEEKVEVRIRPHDYDIYRIMAGDARVQDGVAQITVRKVDTGRIITNISSMAKKIELSTEGLQEIYLCGELIWADGLGISQQTHGMYNARTPYVGDASAMVNLWEQISPSFSGYTVSLQTDSEPYGFTVHCAESIGGQGYANMDASMRKAGECMLALAGNLGVFSWTYTDDNGQSHAESITLEEINALLPELAELYNGIYGTDWTAKDSVKDYAESPFALEQFRELQGMPH